MDWKTVIGIVESDGVVGSACAGGRPYITFMTGTPPLLASQLMGSYAHTNTMVPWAVILILTPLSRQTFRTHVNYFIQQIFLLGFKVFWQLRVSTWQDKSGIV